MTKKRFIKLAMTQVDKKTAQFAAAVALGRYGCYEDAYWDWGGQFKGRFDVFPVYH